MPMKKWEYKLINSNDIPGQTWFKSVNRGVLEQHLNQLGEAGWEIIGIDFVEEHHSEKHFFALARREKGTG